MIYFTLTIFATVAGTTMLWFANLDFMGIFLLVAYLGIFLAVVRSIRVWRDLLNPLCLLLGMCFIRFSLPAYLISRGHDAVPLWDLIGYQARDWQLGHILALTGGSAVALGWSFVSGRWSGRIPLRVRVPRSVAYASVAGMLFGLVCLISFVRMNGGTLDIMASGAFRGMEVQKGTGILFYLSLSLLASSIVLAGYLVSDRENRWLFLTPLTVAVLSFWILGGRATALTPFLSGLLLFWYASRDEEGWGKMPPYRYMLALLGIPLVLWFAHFGILYRGMGFDAFAPSIFDLWEYVKFAVFVDIGQLHSLAGVVRVEPGALEGRSFSGILWPLSIYLELPGRHAGLWMTEQLLGGFEGRRWSLSPTLIGDAYMNFGVLGVPGVMLLVGALLKLFYVRFRQGQLHVVPYTLVIGFGFHIFFASIAKWAYLNAVLICTFALYYVGTSWLDFKFAAENKEAN